jgi:hypothetical protein
VKKSRDTCISRLQDSMLELIKGVGGMSHKVVSPCASCADEAVAAHSLSVAGVAAAGSVIVVRVPSLSARPFGARV